jgi:hypothetical protein
LFRYWWTAKAALDSVKDAPESFDEFKDNGLGPGYVEAVLSGHLEHHNYAGVLLAYASFDEFFTVLSADLGHLLGVAVELSDLKDRGVRRYQKFIHKVCRVTRQDLEIDWDFLEQFSVVRNCIVHANGNKGRLADPKAIERIVDAYPAELSYAHGVKIVVSDAFVVRCVRSTEAASLAMVRFLSTHSNNAMQRTGDAGR